jgi:actin-related protein 6
VLPDNEDAGFPLEAGMDTGNKQILYLSNLTITVPELLFHPSDTGLKTGGISEAVVESLSLLPPSIREEMAHNIRVVGGVAQTKGIHERLEQEVQENISYKAVVIKSEE